MKPKIKFWSEKTVKIGRSYIVKHLRRVLLRDDCEWITIKTEDTHKCGWINTEGIEDQIVWGRLEGRPYVCPLIPYRKAKELGRLMLTRKMSVKYSKEKGAVMVKLAYYGDPIPAFPGSKAATDESIPFWRNHALIIFSDDVTTTADKPNWVQGAICKHDQKIGMAGFLLCLLTL